MTEDLGWAPVPSVSLPWGDINQLILFNLATENGPGLDTGNLWNVDVPSWVAHVHAHPGIKAIIAIGGAGNNNWPAACNDTNRAQLVQNLIKQRDLERLRRRRPGYRGRVFLQPRSIRTRR